MSNSVVPENWKASTYLNSTIKSYADLAYRVKTHFGYPIAVIELTDEMIANHIDDAIERFTQYAGYTEEYLIFCDDLYVPGCGVKLDEIGQVKCNLQQCVLTSEEVYVESVDVQEEILAVSQGLLKVTPFVYTPEYDKCDPANTKSELLSGQTVEIRFDNNNPWDIANVCSANCFRINPKNSKCYELSGNSELSSLTINLEELMQENPDYVWWLTELSGSPYPLSAYPLIELECNILSSIPISSFDINVFYDNTLVGVETTACINIANGKGYIYPKCNIEDIVKCDPLSSQWFNNNVSLLDATHFSSNNIPMCMGTGIPLDSWDGILGTFTLCNTAINTFGPFPIKNVQFYIDIKPNEDVLYKRFCDIQNGGFVLKHNITNLEDCIPAIPDYVEVDIEFLKTTTIENTAIRVVETSSFYDEALESRRKIHGVFSAEPGNEMGYGGFGGNNLLFNFDYALISNVFGYDLQGNRHAFYKNGYDLVTYHAARSFMETTRKMLRYSSYTFNPDTQYLKIIPEPRQSKFDGIYVDKNEGKQCYIVGCYAEKPIEHIIKEKWIQEYVTACMMESIGLIRSQYGTVTLYGGATVSGESLVTMGQSQKEKLLDQLRKENYYSAPPLIFIG